MKLDARKAFKSRDGHHILGVSTKSGFVLGGSYFEDDRILGSTLRFLEMTCLDIDVPKHGSAHATCEKTS